MQKSTQGKVNSKIQVFQRQGAHEWRITNDLKKNKGNRLQIHTRELEEVDLAGDQGTAKTIKDNDAKEAKLSARHYHNKTGSEKLI